MEPEREGLWLSSLAVSGALRTGQFNLLLCVRSKLLSVWETRRLEQINGDPVSNKLLNVSVVPFSRSIMHDNILKL